MNTYDTYAYVMGQVAGFPLWGLGRLTEDKSEQERWRRGGNKKPKEKGGVAEGSEQTTAAGANFS